MPPSCEHHGGGDTVTVNAAITSAVPPGPSSLVHGFVAAAKGDGAITFVNNSRSAR